MGCCFSSEDDDRSRHTIHRTVYSPPPRSSVSTRSTTPTTFSLPSGYNHYNYRKDEYVSRVVPQRPAVQVIRKPTPVTSSSRSIHVPKPIEFKPKPGALYGEYKCSCGYFWVSRLSWRDRYQQCKRCKAHVRPKNQRELKPSDFTSRDKFDESLAHPAELCEMCKQVGGYCGNYK